MSLRNRLKKRTAKRLCVTNVTGLLLRVLSRSSRNINVFLVFHKKILFKRRRSLAENFIEQKYCHACHTGLAVFFPLPSCCVSSLLLFSLSSLSSYSPSSSSYHHHHRHCKNCRNHYRHHRCYSRRFRRHCHHHHHRQCRRHRFRRHWRHDQLITDNIVMTMMRPLWWDDSCNDDNGDDDCDVNGDHTDDTDNRVMTMMRQVFSIQMGPNSTITIIITTWLASRASFSASLCCGILTLNDRNKVTINFRRIPMFEWPF